MRSKLPIIAISWYYAATFGLIRHAKRRLLSPPGEGKRLARSAYRIRRIGACRRRYTQNRKCVPPLIRSGLSRTTFPQGKAFLRRVGTLLQHPTVHPLRPLRCHLLLHAGRQRLAGGAADFFSRIKKQHRSCRNGAVFITFYLISPGRWTARSHHGIRPPRWRWRTPGSAWRPAAGPGSSSRRSCTWCS